MVRSTTRHHLASNAGFTLPEMMVGVALLGLLILLSVTIMRNLSSGANSLTAQSASRQEAFTIVGDLRRYLAQGGTGGSITPQKTSIAINYSDDAGISSKVMYQTRCLGPGDAGYHRPAAKIPPMKGQCGTYTCSTGQYPVILFDETHVGGSAANRHVVFPGRVGTGGGPIAEAACFSKAQVYSGQTFYQVEIWAAYRDEMVPVNNRQAVKWRRQGALIPATPTVSGTVQFLSPSYKIASGSGPAGGTGSGSGAGSGSGSGGFSLKDSHH